MHKLYEYACDELKELEKKTDKGLTAAELEYADKLTELKKNILKIEMLEQDSEYSGRYDGGMTNRSYRGSFRDEDMMMSGARGRGRNARRDSMGRYSSEMYSRAADDVIGQLEDMMESAPDDRSRMKIKDLIREMKNV
jgi:hypothetical protein